MSVPTPKSLVELARDLSNRLRGRYAKGPLMANGEPEFGWAIFTEMPNGDEYPRIYAEAANAFDLLASALSSAEGGGSSVSVDESAMQGTDSLASLPPLSAGEG